MSEVFCQKYKSNMPALDKQPFPGTEGVRILENISAQAWSEWLNFQTMIINENRLNMMDKSAREYLAEVRERFLFEDDDIGIPDDFTDPDIPKLI